MPQQLASNAATAGMPATANDATQSSPQAALDARIAQLRAAGGQSAAQMPTNANPLLATAAPSVGAGQNTPAPALGASSPQPTSSSRAPLAPLPGPLGASGQLPAGSVPLQVKGQNIPIQGMPGYIKGIGPNGEQGMMREPGYQNTQRLLSVPNPNGGVDAYDPAGEKVVSATPNTRDIQKSDYERDSKTADDLADAGNAADTAKIRIQKMRDLLGQINTGANGTTRAQLATLAQTYLPGQVNDFLKNTTGMTDGAAAQELQKYALQGAGQQENKVLGSRGGYQATKLFQSMNPGLELLPDANKALMNSQLISAQADKDYAEGALAHYNKNGDNLRNGAGTYQNLNKFNQDWLAQRNPQIYAGAMGAIAGLPAFDTQVNGKTQRGWATGLSKEEYQKALDTVSKADPAATVNGKSGRLSMQPPNAQGVAQTRAAPAVPAVGTVMQGHRFMGGDPSSPASWQPVQ